MMNITIIAYAMLIVFMYVIMTKKMSPLTTLVFIPLVFSVIAVLAGVAISERGNPVSIAELGKFAIDGIRTTSVTGIMLLFAILYFALMLNAGLFDPVTKSMIRFAKGDPARILVATAIVAAAVSLNGDGTTTTMICCAAFIPIYKKLGLKMMNLGVLLILQNTIMNLLPWGGPTARALSVLHIEENILPYIWPGMLAAALYMIGVGYYLGRQERKRLGITTLTNEAIDQLTQVSDPEVLELRRPKNIWINSIMTIVLLGLLVKDFFPPVFLFMTGTVLALLINYPNLKEQSRRIADNAGDAVQVVILVFAAGLFMGLFTGTGMATAITKSLATIIPASWGGYWGLVVAALSAPGTFFLSNDAFYYGVLPVLAEAGYSYGFTPMQMAVASLMGQAFHLLSPLVAFIYLLLKLTDLDMGQWQRESAKWAIGIFVIFVAILILTGAMPYHIPQG
ncbi:MAG: citrate:proton symporter [Synergistaceae bacterium]|jgi:CitMHS family citrate-Mg2+:H+ or citrate-Ca2+:H+ symporter|nr:citrate:proton symporter [Synergistaceae bacterium]